MTRLRPAELIVTNVIGSSGVSDTTAPTVAITSTETSPTSANPIPLTITFSEAVTGFAVGDITVVGCTLGTLSTSDNIVFTVNATPTARSITIDINAGVCTDASGNSNTAATQFAIVWEYAEYIKDLFTTAIVSHIPLWEASGASAQDYSANNLDGAYSATGITLGEAGIGDGRTSAKVAGTAGYINWYSAGFASAFPGQEGSILIWAKVVNAGAWTDSTVRYAFRIAVNASNQVSIVKHSTANMLQYTYTSGGTQRQANRTSVTETGWMKLAITWSLSNNRVRFFYGGSQVGTNQTIGTWAGALHSDLTLLGHYNKNETDSIWSGWLAHAVVINREATPTEVANCATLPFDDPISVSNGSSSNIIRLADGGNIATAIAQMSAGDTLELATSGTYTIAEGVNGFAALPSGVGVGHTIIHGNGSTVSGGSIGMYFDNKSYIDVSDLNMGDAGIWSLYVLNSDHITFTDCDFYNPADGSSYDVVRLSGSDDCTFTRCNAHSTTDVDSARANDGFELWGPCNRITFTDCVAYNIKNGATAQEGHGFEVYGQLVGETCDAITFDGCEAYNCQVGFSCEGGPLSLSHTNIICDSTSSHDNAFYGYQGIDGSTLYRQNLGGTDNTGNGSAETFGSVTDL